MDHEIRQNCFSSESEFRFPKLCLMMILGNSVEIYFNESDPFEVEASGVASCYDKIILQVWIYDLSESVLRNHARPFRIVLLLFKYESEEIEFCGSNWNEAFAAEDYPIHRNWAFQMYNLNFNPISGHFQAWSKEIGAINSKETLLWSSILIRLQLEKGSDFIFVQVSPRWMLKYLTGVNYMIQLKKTSQPQWRQQGNGLCSDVFEWSVRFFIM